MQRVKEKSAELHWIAEYTDGTKITEDQLSYSQLDRKRLLKFGLYTADGKLKQEVTLSDGKQLFFRMRVEQSLNGTGTRSYLMGYRTKTETVLLTVNPEGKKETASAFDVSSKLKHPIVFFDFEQV